MKDDGRPYVSTRWVKTDYGMKKVGGSIWSDSHRRRRQKVDLHDFEDREEETRQRRAKEWVENSRIAELEKQISEMQETEQRLRKQRDMFYQRISDSLNASCYAITKYSKTVDVDIRGLLKDYEEAYDCSCSRVTPADDLGEDYKNIMMRIKNL